MTSAATPDQLREAWLAQLGELTTRVAQWAEAQGWATRRIFVAREESSIGAYDAPALLLQQEATRILLEPIAREVPGAEGVADLYLLPAYDDIASLYLLPDGWHLQYGGLGADRQEEIESKLLSDESLREVLDELKKNAV